mmetsp:Transcript_53903/g.167040  ORF Transcript_53903/g.167040 Transcript_53903/m.167040 type:complete len:297 (-) Transcript_53903:150-1040(-)
MACQSHGASVVTKRCNFRAKSSSSRTSSSKTTAKGCACPEKAIPRMVLKCAEAQPIMPPTPFMARCALCASKPVGMMPSRFIRAYVPGTVMSTPGTNCGWIPSWVSRDDMKLRRATSLGRFSTYTATFACNHACAACISAGGAVRAAPRSYRPQRAEFCTGSMGSATTGGAMWKPAVLLWASGQLSFATTSLQPLCFTQFQHQFCWPGQCAAEGGGGTGCGPWPRQALLHGSEKPKGTRVCCGAETEALQRGASCLGLGHGPPAQARGAAGKRCSRAARAPAEAARAMRRMPATPA